MRQRIKRILMLVFLALVLMAGAGAVVFYLVGRSGSGAVEKWVGDQLQSIANDYLNPKLTFSDLDYEYPGTVKLKQLRLTADDPRSPGKTIDILGTGDATVTLAEIPSVGKPIKIEKIILNQPLFQAIATGPGEKQLVGFSNLVKQGVVKSATRPESETRKKLSDVFQIRLLELADGKIVYDPRLEGTEPMVLDQINTRLDVQPGEGGTYAVKVTLAREPVFDFDIAMGLNLDTMDARDIDIKLTASLGEDKQSYLPPQVQRVLKEHQVRGELSVKVTGELPLTAYQQGSVLAMVELTDAHLTAGDIKLSVRKLALDAKLADGKLLLPAFKIEALQGELTAGGELALNDALDARLAVQVAGMRIDELFVKPGTAEDPKLAGRLNAGVNVAASLKAIQSRQGLPDKWGDGEVHLDQGRLIKLPVIGELTAAIAGVTGGKKLAARPTEKADATFIFAHDKLQLLRFDYIGELVAARGAGTVSLDKQLDLLVNGGPVEKVQAMLGKDIGGAFGKLTDQLVTYKVGGTTDKPQIGVQVGGVAGKLGGEAAGKVGEGAKDVGKGVGDAVKGLIGK